MDGKPPNSWCSSLSSPVGARLSTAARSTGLKILCDQVEHTQANLAQLEKELDSLLDRDEAVTGLKSAPEFGRKTLAVLRAELGDVTRFRRTDQVVAYADLDLEVKQSGKWKGQAKLSKRGSGRLRRVLYLAAVRSIRLQESAFAHELRNEQLKGSEQA
jgi:transposase